MPLFPTLTQRQLEPELMDDPSLDAKEHCRALDGLGRVHVLSGTESRIWQEIALLARRKAMKKISLMDVGCGDARLLQRLYRRAARHGIELHLIGCDFSERALCLAERDAKSAGIPLELHTIDITYEPLPGTADVVLCSLFLHHFSRQEAVAIIRKLASASVELTLMEDLLRTRLGYLLCLVGIHLLSRSRVVHVDGLLSVRAAFSFTEFKEICVEAGLGGAAIKHCWPERVMASWDTSHAKLEGDSIDITKKASAALPNGIVTRRSYQVESAAK